MQDNQLKKKIIVSGIWFIYFCFGFSVASLSPLVHHITIDLSISYKKMGIILGSWQFIYVLFAIPAGYILDRIAFKNTLFIASIIMSLSLICRSLSENFNQLLFAVALFGLGGSLISVGVSKVTSVYFKGKSRAIIMGILMTAPPLGAIICLAITSTIFLPIYENDWRSIIFIYGFLPIIAGTLWFILNILYNLSYDPKNQLVSIKQQIVLLKSFLSNRRILLTLILAISAFYLNHGLANWMPKILISKGIAVPSASLFATIPVIIGILSALTIPRIAIGRARFYIIIILFLNAAFSVFLIQNDLGIFLITGLILLGITWGPLIAILLTHLTETRIIKSKQAGLAGGLFFTMAEIGGIIGPISVGIIYDYYNNFNYALGFYSLILIVMIIPVMFLKKLN